HVVGIGFDQLGDGLGVGLGHGHAPDRVRITLDPALLLRALADRRLADPVLGRDRAVAEAARAVGALDRIPVDIAGLERLAGLVGHFALPSRVALRITAHYA